ncbi:MAG: sulfatase [Planctomycetota bacterium]
MRCRRTATLVLISLASLCTLTARSTAAESAERPNLLVIQTDEHNFRTLGCYRAHLPHEQAEIWGPGVIVETPHIDRLAREGAICDRYYATSPVCTPSRASLVSGRYPQNTGAIQNDRPMLDSVVTFAAVAQQNGYATGYAGKWHLDGDAKPGWTPARQFGFADNLYMFNRGHWKQLADTPAGPKVKAVDAKGNPSYDVKGADAESFTTDFLTDKTVEFIRKNARQPFCYMVSIPDPHGPNTVRPPYDTMFDHLKFEQPKTAALEAENMPNWGTTAPDKFSPKQMSLYFGMVKCIDDNVGRILAALEKEGIFDRTIVVFTADHGDMCGEHGRHNKGIPLESSARIPFVIRFPAKINPGTVVRPMLGTVDFKPTILSLMGLKSDESVQGRDASRLFLPEGDASWSDVGFVRIGGWCGAFTQRYKLVVAPNTEPALLDLEKDPDELKNFFLDPAYRETVRTLGRALRDYCQKYNEPLFESAAVQADLNWAAEGTGPYVAPERSAPAAGKKAKAAKGQAAKGKAAKGKGKGKRAVAEDE